MIRLWYALAYVVFISREVLAGALRVVVAAFGPSGRSTPAIIEFPLRARTDTEIAVLASSITITPGTLVVGTAPATDRPPGPADPGGGRPAAARPVGAAASLPASAPPTLYVHSLFDADRARVLAGLRDMESRLLRATRGRLP